MSFTKAQDLIELAKMAHARHGGVTLEEIQERFTVTRRTAQRMTLALEETFPNVETRSRSDRRKSWKLLDPVPSAFAPDIEESLEALDLAIREAQETHPRGVAGEIVPFHFQHLAVVLDQIVASRGGIVCGRNLHM